MELFGFEKDTLLDLTVNVIPLGILLFFIAAFALVNPFGVDPVFSGLQFALMISMFLLLAVLTYYAGRAVEDAEHASEAAALDEGEATEQLDDQGDEASDAEAALDGDAEPTDDDATDAS
jgi:membrane protein implicated in regulation of membrane protease activity